MAVAYLTYAELGFLITYINSRNHFPYYSDSDKNRVTKHTLVLLRKCSFIVKILLLFLLI